jgi:ribonucleotide monophosphatase NagD (HAD superfamily)
LFLTNNSSRTPGQYVGKLAALGIHVSQDHVFTSALATAAWLKKEGAGGASVLVIGERGIQEALTDHGFRLVDDHKQADYVVVGFDSGFTYAKAREAALAVRRGALLIATNTDASLPTEQGEIPGAGSIVAMLETATGAKAKVIGKPEPGIFVQALARLPVPCACPLACPLCQATGLAGGQARVPAPCAWPPWPVGQDRQDRPQAQAAQDRLADRPGGTQAGETAMVGDRYETDIVGGHRAGLKTIGVLCGVTSAGRFATANPPADWVFADLGELLKEWQKEHHPRRPASWKREWLGGG